MVKLVATIVADEDCFFAFARFRNQVVFFDISGRCNPAAYEACCIIFWFHWFSTTFIPAFLVCVTMFLVPLDFFLS